MEEDRKLSREEQRELVRERVHRNDNSGKQFIVIEPETTVSLSDDSSIKRVCAYCRVSTDDPAQTTSYELQKAHYEDEINNHKGWEFAGIYADEGISATSMKHRDEFNKMIADCYAGKIDVIITKCVSRFARNVVDCVSIVRKLAQLNPPVGVRFETEGIFTLESSSEMVLTVLAAAAQEESKVKSTAMNWSLEKRFDKGNFLTPVLLGFDHDENGNLIVNHEEANTVKLCFFLYLNGFPLSEIAELLNMLKRRTKRGNVSWSATSIRKILTNERHCGDVLSWKTYTYDFYEHKKRKNKKNRKQVREVDHHEAIVSHEIFEATQAKLASDKYSRRGLPLPSLKVIDRGALKGFVSVNRMWRGFSSADYSDASSSVYSSSQAADKNQVRKEVSSDPLANYEIVRSDMFSDVSRPSMVLSYGKVFFNSGCMKKFQNVEYVELLINTVEQCIAIRPCEKSNPNAIEWCCKHDNRSPMYKSMSGFSEPLFSIMGWNRESKYKVRGEVIQKQDESILLFDLSTPIITKIKKLQHESTVDNGSVNLKNSSAESIMDDEEEVIDIEIITEAVNPDGLSFGTRIYGSCNGLWERIHLLDNWDILRPARVYRYYQDISETMLKEIRAEADSIIQEMQSAV